MTKIADFEPLPPKVLLYSPAGGGKSTLVMTAGEKLQLIDLDPGATVALSIHDKFRKERLNVDVVRIRDADPSKAVAWEAYKKYIQQVTNQVNAGTFPYKLLCIDSLTTMAEMALRSVLHNSGNANNCLPSIQQWGIAINEVKNAIIFLRALKIPVVLTAHCQSTVADNDNKMGIAIYGRDLPNYIPRYFDEIWYVHVRAQPTAQNQPQQYAFTLQTTPSAGIMARSRSGVPNEINCDKGFDAIIQSGTYRYPEDPKPKETPSTQTV